MLGPVGLAGGGGWRWDWGGPPDFACGFVEGGMLGE
jgi:hypothetical protein